MNDVLYPDNPKKREKVARLHQELIDSMELNFNAVNTLIEILNTHWSDKLSPITMNKEGTIRENCDVFLKAMKSIQDVLKEVDKRLSSELEPDLYKKLHDFQETDVVKKRILLDMISEIGGSVAGAVAWPLFGMLIYSNAAENCLSKIVGIVGKVGTSAISGAVAGVIVGLAVGLIVSAICGAIERKNLEEAIQELQLLVDKIKPASQKYYETIIEVKVMLRTAGK